MTSAAVPVKKASSSDVDHLAQQRLFDDFDAELLGQREDRVAGDAVEHGVRQRRGVENAAADEEQILTRALGQIAVPVSRPMPSE